MLAAAPKGRTIIKVSVVVPVYNAGPYLERCAPSLLGQSLDPSEYEVIYVDDGSTDESAEKLAGLASEHPNVRWVSQSNSGWPGKPRNVGVSMAAGEYVQFVDQDDELAPEALERLYALGSRNGSDIVAGKMGGTMTGPNPLWQRTVECAGVSEIPMIESLTGHKMFRRAFLEAHALRFPEGYWRMEDLLFVVSAYTHAERVSVLADYTCYLWNKRDDGGNNSKAAFDLASHYERLRIIIDVLRDGTEPGPAQDAMLRRLYRIETFRRVREPFILNEANPRHEAFGLVRDLARTAFPPGVREGMPALQRVRAHLVEADAFEGAVDFARRMGTLTPKITRGRPTWDDGVLKIPLRCTLNKPGGVPLQLVPTDTGLVLDPAFLDGLPLPPIHLDDPLEDAQASLQLRDEKRQVWWYPEGLLPVAAEALDLDHGTGASTLVAAGTLGVDPARAAAGQPLAPGVYDVWFVAQLFGAGRRRRVVLPDRPAKSLTSWVLSADADVVTRVRSSEDGRLQLEVRRRQKWLSTRLSTGPEVEGSVPGGRVDVVLRGEVPACAVPLQLVTLGTKERVTATLTKDAAGSTATLEMPTPAGLSDGIHTLKPVGGTALLNVKVQRGAVLWTAPAGYTPPMERLKRGVARRVRGLVRKAT